MRGDIETPWAGRAKEYAWSLMERYAPRKITPSDIDYIVECRGHFVAFEMKTGSADLSYGQRLMLERLLNGWTMRSRVVVIRHAPLDRVVIPEHVETFETWRWSEDGVLRGGPYSGADFAEWYGEWFKKADRP